jgi:hypothetical protein
MFDARQIDSRALAGAGTVRIVAVNLDAANA